AKPELGVNAISQMARIVSALEEDAVSIATTTHPLLGAGTFNIGTITGGTQVNIVPDFCVIEVDRRLLPGDEPSNVLRHYIDLVGGIPGLRAEAQPVLEDCALETTPQSSVVSVASEVLSELGLNDTPCGVPYGSNASKLSRAAIPSIVFGPGSIDQA